MKWAISLHAFERIHQVGDGIANRAPLETVRLNVSLYRDRHEILLVCAAKEHDQIVDWFALKGLTFQPCVNKWFYVEILLLIIVVLFALFIPAYLRSPEFKGWRGEARVAASIQRNFDTENHVLLNDLTFSVSNGTTQIDHVFISPSGVFVIETKNMSGWIFGSKNQARWTQTLYRQKFQFQNPLRQNYKHVKTVQTLLGLKADQVHNLVVFAGSALPKTVMPENVLWGADELSDYIRRQSEALFRPHDIRRMAAALEREAMVSGRDTDRSHVENLRVQASKRNDPSRCPKCGSELVERKNRKTGEVFFGCSEFPKCRGTRKS